MDILRLSIPLMVFFKEDGSVAFFDSGKRILPSVTEIKSVIVGAKKYIKKYKTDDEVERVNIDYFKNKDIEDTKKRISDKKDRILNPPQKIDVSCFIYLMKDTIRGLHKIGMAGNVGARFKQLKTANAGIELVCFYRGKESDEQVIHSVLRSFGKNVDCEWFLLSTADLDYFHNYFQPIPF